MKMKLNKLKSISEWNKDNETIKERLKEIIC